MMIVEEDGKSTSYDIRVKYKGGGRVKTNETDLSFNLVPLCVGDGSSGGVGAYEIVKRRWQQKKKERRRKERRSGRRVYKTDHSIDHVLFLTAAATPPPPAAAATTASFKKRRTAAWQPNCVTGRLGTSSSQVTYGRVFAEQLFLFWVFGTRPVYMHTLLVHACSD